MKKYNRLSVTRPLKVVTFLGMTDEIYIKETAVFGESSVRIGNGPTAFCYEEAASRCRAPFGGGVLAESRSPPQKLMSAPPLALAVTVVKRLDRCLFSPNSDRTPPSP